MAQNQPLDLNKQNYSLYTNQAGNSEMDTCEITQQQVSSLYGQLPSSSGTNNLNMEHCISSTTNTSDNILPRSSRLTSNSYNNDHVIHSNIL